MVDQNSSPETGLPKRGPNILLWVLGIGGLCLVACCGGAGIMAWKFGANMATTDPAEVRKQTAEMVAMAIPDKYQPVTAMNMVAFRFVIYQTQPGGSAGGMLMLMEWTMQSMGVDAKQQEQELRKSMQQQQGKQGFTPTNTETREIDIGGQTVAFEFSEGTGSGNVKMRSVSGVFRGKRGPVMLQLVVPEDEYDEEAVMQMLKSIEVGQ
jgi:hypothetical protein